ncbi:MAG: radical SAM family heme chaperone HemW [Prevotellaceae bacterium]|jgi:oxygen-independent coproporphyrinogen-3 oxidase|nr:radical SAM family heme chaperone HemW [Prevotellaceae bacterium]
MLYIHVPFCKSRCIYCSFFSSLKHDFKEKYVDCLCKEIAERKGYLPNNQLDTIYFGGGTPSLLSENNFERIFNAIKENFVIKNSAEITLECNPDDLTQNYISVMKKIFFNRVSVGIQSFNDSELRFLNRRHNAQTAKKAVQNLQRAGFSNISVDLMFGLPKQTLQSWENTVNEAIKLDVQHISAYSLSYEKGTKLENLRKSGEISEISEENSEKMFDLLTQKLQNAGFEHYEISNYCKHSFHSRHNSGYWQMADYLGVGAAAHSFNGVSRRWNVADIEKYCSNFSYEKEILTPKDKYNELVFLSLRTKNGLDLQQLKEKSGVESYDFCLSCAEKYLASKKLFITDNHLKINENAVIISDLIMSDLMKI